MRATEFGRRVAVVSAFLVALAPASSAVMVPHDPGESLDAVCALQELVHARFDWAHHVEVESEENTAKAGEAYFSDVSHVSGTDPQDEVWLLRQRSARSYWHNYGMVVRKGAVYFAVLEGRPRLLGAECVECHPNGPRALAGVVRSGQERDRRTINTIVTHDGVIRPYYPRAAPEPASALQKLEAAGCADCHNGADRSKLSRLNARAIGYRVAHGTMPPDRLIAADDARTLNAWLAAR